MFTLSLCGIVQSILTSPLNLHHSQPLSSSINSVTCHTLGHDHLKCPSGCWCRRVEAVSGGEGREHCRGLRDCFVGCMYRKFKEWTTSCSAEGILNMPAVSKKPSAPAAVPASPSKRDAASKPPSSPIAKTPVKSAALVAVAASVAAAGAFVPCSILIH